MEYQVITRQVPEQRIVSLRGRTSPIELPTYVGTAFGRLYSRLGEAGIVPSGEPLAIYHEWGPDSIDVEACVPVAAGALGGEVAERVLPAATVAQTLHVGSYDSLMGAYQAVAAWIGSNGYTDDGPSRERYLVGPGGDIPEADYRTQVETPVTRALVTAG
ncbi:MAG TPA: GyrI-like domain-containing protein [Candidatus Limnocylindrales bacterium]|nr:GyrI-like domain-containing protein [Candidatus Limnocylindrales bacterium]